ncbi:MAG TPA: alpha/beta hydrolase family protein [Alphaproteobacteria bacterium]|nr:alpha/beta hydrolase family protein [Alphaproteobacteria bacterium]
MEIPSILDLARTPAGHLLFRPWFDRVALAALTRWVFPASRLWASAEAAEYRLERLLAANPGLSRARIAPDLLLGAMAETQRIRARAIDAERRCDDLFFGGVTADQSVLAGAETARRRTGQNFVATRLRFIYPARRADIAAVDFAIPAEDELVARFGKFRDHPSHAFLPPAESPKIDESAQFTDKWGVRSMLRFVAPSADVGDVAYARVYAPPKTADPPTLIHCHGVAVESDSIDLAMDEIMPLVGQGVRVVRPIAPWHGRRRLFGTWSGEPFFRRAPLSAFTLLCGLVQELAVLIAWCKRTSGGLVGVSGVSLGALTAQLAAAHLAAAPAAMRPDALFLVATSDRLDRVALEGTLTRALGLDRALRAAGWTDARLEPWRPFSDPLGPPCVPPERIVMLLGTEDDVTPYDGGTALAERWRVPKANRFHRRQGHFSVSLGLLPDAAPLRRAAAILAGRG